MEDYNPITELMKLIPNESKDKARILINRMTSQEWTAAKRRYYNSEKTGIYAALDKALFYTFEYSLDQATARSNKPEVCSIRQIIAYYLIVNLSYSDTAASEILKRDRSTMNHSVKAVRNRIQTSKNGYRELENFTKIMNVELGILTTENLEGVENAKHRENIGLSLIAKPHFEPLKTA
jgi:hypothetical protein